jgi:hypothetical protein
MRNELPIRAFLCTVSHDSPLAFILKRLSHERAGNFGCIAFQQLLVNAELFARIRRMCDRFDAFSKRVVEVYAELHVEKGLAEIDSWAA